MDEQRVALSYLLLAQETAQSDPRASLLKHHVSQSREFVVMQYNILARPYTKYMKELHRSGGTLESFEQTKLRYTMAAEEILEIAADVVCLQEIEEAFFKMEFNSYAIKLKKRYIINVQIGKVGTAVLVRKMSNLHICGEVLNVKGGADTGGDSKSSVCVPLRYCNNEYNSLCDQTGNSISSIHGNKESRDDTVWVVTAHLAFTLARRLEHLKQIQDALEQQQLYGWKDKKKTCPSKIILMGDFNTSPDSLPELTQNSFISMRGMQLLAPKDFALTCMGPDLQHPRVCIDYVFVSPELSVVDGSVVVQPDGPFFPYSLLQDSKDCDTQNHSPAKVVRASDHSWVCATLKFN